MLRRATAASCTSAGPPRVGCGPDGAAHPGPAVRRADRRRSRRQAPRALAVAALASVLGGGLGVTAAHAAVPGGPQGPDVASFQHPSGTPIDWAAVRAAGQSFAFVKATEDTGYVNPYFSQDWAAARAAGLFRGAYHFARPQDSAVAQADLMARAVGPLRPGDLPPVLDLEVTGGLGSAALIAWTHAFLNRVQADTGRVPMIYTGLYFWRTSLANSTAFASYPLWIASYGVSSPTLPGGWRSWSFWQYTDSNSLPGIAGQVDGSVAAGGVTAVAALAHAEPERIYDLGLHASLGLAEPSAATQTADIAALRSGAVSRQTLATNVLASFAARVPQAWRLFTTIMGRQPSSSELNLWASRYAGTGVDEQDMSLALVTSAEFRAQHAAFGDASWAAALYPALLGRTVPVTGVTGLTAALARGWTHRQVAAAVLNSLEGRLQRAAGAWQLVLHRTPDYTGLSATAAALNEPGSLNRLRAWLYASREFLADQYTL